MQTNEKNPSQLHLSDIDSQKLKKCLCDTFPDGTLNEMKQGIIKNVFNLIQSHAEIPLEVKNQFNTFDFYYRFLTDLELSEKKQKEK